MNGIEIVGGIGLTLFGVRFLRKGLDRLFGGTLMHWLSERLSNRVVAFTGGIAAGVVAPSSTGIALLTTQILTTSPVSRVNMLACQLGTNIGITVAVQLLAFRLQDYAGLLIIGGVIFFQFLKREFLRGVGQCVLALGFIFLAVRLIGNGARSLSASPELTEAISLIQGHPLFALVVVGGLAVLLQSSTATIGLGLGLSASGLLSPNLMIPWVLGTSLGLSVTLLLAGWKSLESRRLGTSNLLIKIFTILPFLLWPRLGLILFEGIPSSLGRQMAMFFTEFNLLAGLIFLPLLGGIDRMALLMFPDPEQERSPEQESFLNDAVLGTPSLALARATRETLRMTDRVRWMLDTFWEAFAAGNIELARRLQKEDDGIDRINLELANYLGRITEARTGVDSHWQLVLLGFANEMESAGDLIDKYLCDLLIKQQMEGISLHPIDRQSVQEGYKRLTDRFELASGLLTSRNGAESADFLAGKELFNDWARKAQEDHYERLYSTTRSEIVSSAFFLDYLNAFRQINGHLSSIGYALRRLDGTFVDVVPSPPPPCAEHTSPTHEYAIGTQPKPAK